MSVRTELKRTVGDTRRAVTDTRKVIVDTRRVLIEAKPLYAVAGAGDMWVAKLRETGSRIQSTRIEPAAVQRLVSESVDGLQSGVIAVQGQLTTLPTVAVEAATRLVDSYDELAKRGEKTVGRIRRQRATQDLSAQAAKTTSRAKATSSTARKGAASTTAQAKSAATTARKSAASTTTKAKATATAARKTAGAGRKAAAAAADKVG